ncbi:MAG: hypothetical protein IJD10_04805 [Clostridia bacterium]|nr:hypothetical protein [Clostridia bacterium]
MRNKKLLILSTAFFGAVEALLGMFLQVAEGRAVSLYSYAAVVLACLFCGVFVEWSAGYGLTQTALLFTVFADYYLVLSFPREQLPAMLCFSVTQLAYFGRIYLADDKAGRKRWHLVSRLLLSVAALSVTAVVLGKRTDAVALISMFYYANLILNIVFAFADFRKQPLLALGLLLFLGCDTVVGLSCLEAYFAIPRDSLLYDVIHPGFDLAWAFYVPSQALLAVNLLPDRLRRIQNNG